MPAYNARVALRATELATGRLCVNVLHVECDVLASPPNWANIAADMKTWLATKWNNILVPAFTFQDITVTDENYPGSTHGQGVANVNTVGARVPNDSKLDPAMCQVGSWKTAVAKRYARGHIFFPPAVDTTSIATGGIFNSGQAYYIANAAFMTSFQAGFVAGSTSYVPIVFSKHQVSMGITPFTFPITGVILNSKQHWLRSRSTAP